MQAAGHSSLRKVHAFHATHLPFSPELASSLYGLVDVTGVKWACMVGSLAKCLMELELQDETGKVPAKNKTHSIFC